MIPLALEVRAMPGDETEIMYIMPDEIASWHADPPSAGDSAESSRLLFKHRAEVRVCMSPGALFEEVKKAMQS